VTLDGDVEGNVTLASRTLADSRVTLRVKWILMMRVSGTEESRSAKKPGVSGSTGAMGGRPVLTDRSRWGHYPDRFSVRGDSLG